MSDFATECCSEHADALEMAILNAKKLNIQITFDLGDERATYNIRSRDPDPYWITEREGRNYRKVETEIAQGLRNLLADAWPIKIVGLRAGAISIEIPLSQLRTLALRAWCEAAGLEEPAVVPKRIESTRRLKNAMRARVLADLHKPDGGATFSNRSFEAVAFAGHLRHCDLSHLDLSGVAFEKCGMKRFIASNFAQTDLSKSDLSGCVINKCDFRQANLEEAHFRSAKAVSADFSGAKLRAASFWRANLSGAKFCHAQLQDVNFEFANISGVDLTSTDVTSAKFLKTGYDENTRWPEGFLDSLFYKKTAELKTDYLFKLLGEGKDPLVAHEVKLIAKRGHIDFERLIKRLKDAFYGDRVRNALTMLQATRFQLFVDVKPDSLSGIIKSQADPWLIYSCRLTETGAFSCCTQTLAKCDGMRGLVCKHILVLLLGVTNAGAIEPATACEWVLTSRKRRPKLDQQMSADSFLRYMRGQAGELDWRPTETMPEDYYAY